MKTRIANSASWSSVRFSPNGQYILISTTGNMCHVVDAFMGNLIWTFSVRRKEAKFQRRLFSYCAPSRVKIRPVPSL